jgi:xanthine dehydrogenase iron-sulfur cluster and FAD-binding subunit A
MIASSEVKSFQSVNGHTVPREMLDYLVRRRIATGHDVGWGEGECGHPRKKLVDAHKP